MKFKVALEGSFASQKMFPFSSNSIALKLLLIKNPLSVGRKKTVSKRLIIPPENSEIRRPVEFSTVLIFSSVPLL